MTRSELRDHLQRLIERELELICRTAHTGPRWGSNPAIRVFVDGGEHIVLIGKLLPSATAPPVLVEDVLAPLPGEIQHGRPCTAAEVAELDRTEDW